MGAPQREEEASREPTGSGHVVCSGQEGQHCRGMGAELQAHQVQSAGAEVCTLGPEQVTVLEVEAFRGDRGEVGSLG